MNMSMSYIIVTLFIIGFSYILAKQLKYTLSIQKNRKPTVSKRLLVGSYLTTFSIAGFLISFLLNLSLYMQMLQPNILTSNNTAIACFLFLLVSLISKYGITPNRKTLITIK